MMIIYRCCFLPKFCLIKETGNISFLKLNNTSAEWISIKDCLYITSGRINFKRCGELTLVNKKKFESILHYGQLTVLLQRGIGIDTLKMPVQTKETVSKVKRQPSEWEKIIANEVNDKE